MKTSIYKKLVKRQMHTIAFKELVEISKSKEKRNILNMTVFKWPTSFSQKQSTMFQKKIDIFALRTEMNLNPNNFSRKIYCEKGCPEEQTNFKILVASEKQKRKKKSNMKIFLMVP